MASSSVSLGSRAPWEQTPMRGPREDPQGLTSPSLSFHESRSQRSHPTVTLESPAPTRAPMPSLTLPCPQAPSHCLSPRGQRLLAVSTQSSSSTTPTSYSTPDLLYHPVFEIGKGFANVRISPPQNTLDAVPPSSPACSTPAPSPSGSRNWPHSFRNLLTPPLRFFSPSSTLSLPT